MEGDIRGWKVNMRVDFRLGQERAETDFGLETSGRRDLRDVMHDLSLFYETPGGQ